MGNLTVDSLKRVLADLEERSKGAQITLQPNQLICSPHYQHSLFGLPVCINNWLKGCQVKAYPHKLKKYKKRTLKRWAKNPKHYTPPQYWKIDNAIWCNSASFEALRRQINA